jgi:hypothetical protein
MAKFDVLAGTKVVFTGANGTQEGTFEIGKEYEVVRHGNCYHGEGVMVGGEKHGFVIVEGNFVPAEVKKPTPLNLREFLQALYDEQDVVSVDPEDGTIDDTYDCLQALANDIAYFEIEDNVFYLQEEYNDYRKAVAEAEARKEEPVGEPEPAPVHFTFTEAVIKLSDGIAVYSVDEDGDVVDTYETTADLVDLASFETECKWYEKF